MPQTPTLSSHRPARIERHDTIIIGAGQAGLATGYELSRLDADFAILDGAARVGESWRTRWDSLRLFTPAKYSALPGMVFPAPADHLPDKDEVADYLERYAERFELPVRLGTRVRTLGHDGDRFVIAADGRRFEADRVVVATGPFQRPKVPALAARLDRSIRQIHSVDYRNPFALPDGPALVVGVGNSGAQIAMELARFRPVWLAGRETGALPRTVLGRDIYDWIWPLLRRLTTETRAGRALRERTRRGDPLIGIPRRALCAGNVTRIGRVTDVRGGLPVCDGRTVEPAVVVWCTGFDPDYGWIDLPVTDDAGALRQHRGVAADVPGLYFVGQRFQHTQTSALLGGVGADAAYVAEQVVRHEAERERAAA